MPPNKMISWLGLAGLAFGSACADVATDDDGLVSVDLDDSGRERQDQTRKGSMRSAASRRSGLRPDSLRARAPWSARRQQSRLRDLSHRERLARAEPGDGAGVAGQQPALQPHRRGQPKRAHADL